MTTSHAGPAAFPVPRTWVRVVLGVVLILAGLIVLGDVSVATLISTKFIAIVAMVAGGFEIVHAFWTKGWGAFIWQIALGILYVAFGVALLNQPVQGALVITFVLGLLLFLSGFVRILLSLRVWGDGGWLMLLSGTFGMLAGLVILSGWPVTGLWVLGALLGIDLIMHGLAWLAHGWFIPAARAR